MARLRHAIWYLPKNVHHFAGSNRASALSAGIQSVANDFRWVIRWHSNVRVLLCWRGLFAWLARLLLAEIGFLGQTKVSGS